jgi:hypothetical protein
VKISIVDFTNFSCKFYTAFIKLLPAFMKNQFKIDEKIVFKDPSKNGSAYKI